MTSSPCFRFAEWRRGCLAVSCTSPATRRILEVAAGGSSDQRDHLIFLSDSTMNTCARSCCRPACGLPGADGLSGSMPQAFCELHIGSRSSYSSAKTDHVLSRPTISLWLSNRSPDKPMILALLFVEFRLQRAMVPSSVVQMVVEHPSGARTTPTIRPPFVKRILQRADSWFRFKRVAIRPSPMPSESPIIINLVVRAVYRWPRTPT